MKHKVRLDYSGSLVWLIFWFIVFFPIALMLLLTGAEFTFTDKRYALEYEGSRFWLCFWTLVFFPIAIILLLLGGISVVIEDVENIDRAA